MRASLKIILLLVLCARIAVGGNAIQFSASAEEFVGEGVVYHRLRFRDGDKTVSFRAPNNWSYAVIDTRLRLTPNDVKLAEGYLESAPLEKPVTFDDAVISSVAQQLLAALPAGNQNAAVLKQEQNTIPLSGNPTLETIVSYKLMGETFQRGVIIALTPNNQITFRFSARKADFDTLYRAFRASIASWQWQPQTASVASAN